MAPVKPCLMSSGSHGSKTNVEASSVGRIDPLKAIKFYPVSSRYEFHNPPIHFCPLFAHHFFVDDGFITGFDDGITISFYYIPSTFEVYLHVDGHMLPQAADLPSPLETLRYNLCKRTPFPGGFIEDVEVFERLLHYRSSHAFVPPGCCIHQMPFKGTFSFLPIASDASHVSLQIYECAFSEGEEAASPSVLSSPQTLSNSPNPTVEASTTPNPDTCDPYFAVSFDVLHRRMEWFLHWFIESASPIESDERWRVILPYIVSETPVSPPNTPFRDKKKGSTPSNDRSSKRHKSMSPLKIIQSSPAAKQSGSTKGSNVSERDASPKMFKWQYHLAGFATTYTFFSINQNRRRISQFMIFPHMQHNGIGMVLLERIYYEAIQDKKVCEITVEDPASTFTQLRDIVSLQICFNLKRLPNELLYPPKTGSKDKRRRQKDKKSKGDALESIKVVSKHELVQITKETFRQAIRMQETLMLARILPVGEGEGWRVVGHRNKGESHCGQNGGREASEYENGRTEQSFAESDAVKDVRISIKKRLRRDHLDDFADLPGVGLSCGGNETYKELVKAELRSKWMEHYTVYCRTIRKLRKLFPRDPMQ